MKVSDFKDLDWLLARMSKLQKDWPKAEYHQLRKQWHRMKRRIEDKAQEPGEALALFTQIFATEGWKHWRKTSKAIFEASEAGKKKRARWSARGYERRKQKPGYHEAKKAYDQARHQVRKLKPGYREAKSAYNKARYQAKKSAKL